MKKLLLTLVLCFFTVVAFAQDRIVYTRPDGGVSIVMPTGDVSIVKVFTKDVPPDATDAQIIDSGDLLTDRTFRNAWHQSGGIISVNMPLAREIHAGRIAHAQIAEIARLKVDERAERLKGNTAQANAHAATVTALEALDLNVLATQIANAPNPTALRAIWPANVPR